MAAKQTATAKCERCAFIGEAAESSQKKAREEAEYQLNRHTFQEHTAEGRLQVARTSLEVLESTLKWRDEQFRELMESMAADLERCANDVRQILTRNDGYVNERQDFRQPRFKLAQEAVHKLLWMIPNTHAYDIAERAEVTDKTEAQVKAARDRVTAAERLVAMSVEAVS